MNKTVNKIVEEIERIEMRNKVFACLGIRAKNANFNADFEGKPKTLRIGKIIASDKAFKYPIKYKWRKEGKDIMFIKTLVEDKDKKITNTTLEQKYSLKFGKLDEKNKNKKEIILNLFQYKDILNFGATFAVKGNNISITGVVQFGQGENKYEYTQIESQDILAPLKSDKEKDNVPKKASNKKDEKAIDIDSTNKSETENIENETSDSEGSKGSTSGSIGKKITTDEAHYFVSLNVNPKQLDEFKPILEGTGFIGYAKQDYEELKQASLSSVTELNTNAKFGCQNEFALFVELKDGSDAFLPELNDFIDFSKENEDKGRNIIDLSRLDILLKASYFAKEIDKVEVYYNAFDTNLITTGDYKKFNIITREEI